MPVCFYLTTHIKKNIPDSAVTVKLLLAFSFMILLLRTGRFIMPYTKFPKQVTGNYKKTGK